MKKEKDGLDSEVKKITDISAKVSAAQAEVASSKDVLKAKVAATLEATAAIRAIK